MQLRSTLTIGFLTAGLSCAMALAAHAPAPVVCGGPEQLPCGEDEYCRRPMGVCGADTFGVCLPSSFSCSLDYDPVCGCDGRTYSNECWGLIAGVAYSGECARVCSTSGYQCKRGSFCRKAQGHCGNTAFGNCRAAPWSCPDENDPVCGCDGTTYPNECAASAAEVSIVGFGPCPDACPEDPDKTEPGTCGCGVADSDADGDRTADCVDACPGDARRDRPGFVGTEFQVNESWLFNQSARAADVDAEGDSIVVWEGDGVFARHFDATGRSIGAELLLSFDGEAPDVATQTAGTFVVVGTTLRGGAVGDEIVGRRFDAAGVPLSAEIPISQHGLDRQVAAQVDGDAVGNFVVAWISDGQDGDGWGVFARRFDAAGVPRGDEFQVNTTSVGDQSQHALAVEPSGAFLIAWQGDDEDGRGVLARRFTADGRPAGDEFRVNTQTAGWQGRPEAAFSASGDAFIAWVGTDEGGDGRKVFARRFDTDGAPLGDEFAVTSVSLPWLSVSGVVMDAAGSALVVWSGAGDEIVEHDVFGQRFDRDGLPVGGAFRINTFTRDLQLGQSVAADAAGRFAVVWTSWMQDGFDHGVFGRRGTIREDIDGDGAPDCDLCVQSSPQACCDPATGIPLAVDDGDSCTADVCHPDGTVTHAFVPMSPLGDSLRLDKIAASTALHWTLPVGGLSANLYRGTIGPAEDWAYDESCFVAETAGDAEDPATPAPRHAFYYLVSVRGTCGESAVGIDAAGEVRFATPGCAGAGP